ncbi:MAG: PIN domain-containing protein [Nitrospirota bacterium]
MKLKRGGSIRKTHAKSYVMDTSAILTLWNDEEGADIVEKVLRDAFSCNNVYLSFMTFMECRYHLLRNKGREISDEFYRDMESLPIKRIDVTEPILEKASEIKAANRLSVADSWIIATAFVNQSILIHKNPEFEQVKKIVRLLALPYK